MYIDENMLEAIHDMRKHRNHLKYNSFTYSWVDIKERFNLDVSPETVKSRYFKWLRRDDPTNKDRKTPLLEDKFNWSFLNQRWNGGTMLAEYKREDWHHPKEYRNKKEVDENTYRSYKLSDTDINILNGIDI